MLKKAACVIPAFLLCACLLCGCIVPSPGLQDWASEPLLGNYEIWRLSVHDIQLVKRTDKSSAATVIGAEIYAVAWNEDVIYLQHEEMPSGNESKEPHGELDYYIFVVADEEVLGPFTLAEFEQTCTSRGYPVPTEWTNVHDLPRQNEGGG